MKRSSEWKLYVIVDRDASRGIDVTEIASAAIRGGADALQLREKRATDAQVRRDAERLLPLTRAAGVALIINDRIEVAGAVGADGVHLGQEDPPVAEARCLLGPSRLIGKSTHSQEQALAAEAEGASYIGLGPVFPTPTKPDYGSIGPGLIAQVRARVRIPIVCIGGIELSTLPAVLGAGARCVAVVRAVCAAEDPEAAARALKTALRQSVRATAASGL